MLIGWRTRELTQHRIPTKLGSATTRHPDLCLQHATAENTVQHSNIQSVAHSLSQSEHRLLRNVRCRFHAFGATGRLRYAMHEMRRGPS